MRLRSQRLERTDSGRAAALASRAEINKAYERRRIAGLQADLGLDTVRFWDLPAPIGRVAPRFTIQQASAHVLAAAAPLGPSAAVLPAEA